MSREKELQNWRSVLLWTLVIFIVFVVAVGVIVRFSIRYRAYLLRGADKPTADEDLWQQYKLPDGLDDPSDASDRGDDDTPAAPG